MKKHLRFVGKFCVYLLVCAFIVSSFGGIANSEEYELRDNLRSEKITKGKRFKRDLARIRKAISAHNKHRNRLMDIASVFATATGISREGEPVIKIFTSRAERAGIPDFLDEVRVVVEQTERIYALADPLPLPTDRWDRPVPIGISTGHPDITAGTIGSRVSRGASLYALSNNHVYADINQAFIGDAVIQPGTADGGSLPDDLIGTLADYEMIRFCQVFFIWLICSETNTIDAAIAAVSESDLGVSTPPDGYGTPNAVIHPAYGHPDVIDDAGEDLAQLLGSSVQKYGRTTRQTSGTIDAINATVDVCYDQACSQVARFVDQLIIVPGDFSAGGDSGSLIVTNDADKNPVGLLFAGSSSHTIANRIDRVLNTLNVEIDSEPLTVTPPTIPPVSSGPHLQIGKALVSTDAWTTVTLNHDYADNMVVVCTPNYEHDSSGPVTMPVVVHVRNAMGNSFEVKLVQAVGGAFEVNQAWVHWMAVEAGVYNDADHGVKMEAAKFNSIITDRSGSWLGTNRTYAQAYTNPVVVGQVMSLNSYDETLAFDLWSLFWCRGSSTQNPPNASSLWVGKHAGEDSRSRDNELLGYIVIEAGSGNIGTTDYIAALGSDSIRGMGDNPPYSYSVSGLSDPDNAIAILSQAAMDGGNGGWAILHGNNPIAGNSLHLAIDEDQAWDNERRHTTEQVGYIVFEE